MKPEPDDLSELALRYTAAWCSHNAASVAAFFSPNGSFTINAGAPAVGRSAITSSVQGFMTAFPDLRVIMDNLVTQNDRAEYHWTLIGTNTGPGGTGRQVRVSGFEVWRIGDDGLIAESQGHFDATEYQRQLERGATRMRVVLELTIPGEAHEDFDAALRQIPALLEGTPAAGFCGVKIRDALTVPPDSSDYDDWRQNRGQYDYSNMDPRTTGMVIGLPGPHPTADTDAS